MSDAPHFCSQRKRRSWVVSLSNLSKSDCGSGGKRARERRVLREGEVIWMMYSITPGASALETWQMGSILNSLLDSRLVAVSIKFHSLRGRHIHSGGSTNLFSGRHYLGPFILGSSLGDSQYLLSILSVTHWGLAIRKSLSQAQFILGDFQ